MKNYLIDRLQAHGESRMREGYFCNRTLLSSLQLLAALLLCCFYQQSWAKDGNFGGGDGSSSNPYLIEDAADLGAFRDKVNAGNTSICGKLTADIDLSTVCGESIGSWEPIGVIRNGSGANLTSLSEFTGTFNGNGKSISGLYVNYQKIQNRTTDYQGLFGYNGGEIQNLHVNGYYLPSGCAGGIAAWNLGKIINCSFSGSFNHKGDYIGGITGHSAGEIINCWSDAKIYAQPNDNGGICGYSEGSISNCLFGGKLINRYYVTKDANPTEIPYYNNNSIVSDGSKGTISNCYYLNGTDSKATQVTADQLKSGYVAQALQNGNNTYVWGQTIGTDTMPRLTSVDSAQVYFVKYLQGSTAFDSLYVNRYNTLNLPTAERLAGSNYSKYLVYTPAYKAVIDNSETEVTKDTKVTADMQVTCSYTVSPGLNGKGTTDYPYLISTAENLAAFRDYVNLGNTAICGKLTQDIDLSTVCGESIGSWEPIASGYKLEYRGTFNGNRHAIKSLYFKKDNYGTEGPLGLFGNLYKPGIVENLHVNGAITVNITSEAVHVGGIVGVNSGIVSYCSFSGKISDFGKTGQQYGGIAGLVYKGGQIINCWSDAEISGHSGVGGIAGFVSNYTNSDTEITDTSKITNCLFTGKVTGSSGVNAIAKSYGAVTNCYYLNGSDENATTKITADQLKSGYVAYALQNGAETNIWGQTIGTDTMPCLTSDEEAQLYRVIYTHDDIAFDTTFVNRNKPLNTLPLAKDFLGSSYNPGLSYTVSCSELTSDGTTGNAVTTETPITSDLTLACTATISGLTLPGSGTIETPYEIASTTDLLAFCDYVNLGNTTIKAKFTADIDYGSVKSVWPMINNFAGTLDGNGHTLSNFNQGAGTWNPLFSSIVTGGVVKNLTLDKARKLIQGNEGSALVARSNAGTVSGILVKNSLVQCGNYNNLAGIVSKNSGTIIDCAVIGTTIQHIWSGANTKTLAGICGYNNPTGVISNCFTANNIYSQYNPSYSADEGSSSIVVRSSGTVINCFADVFLPKDSLAPRATLVTAAQLQSGAIAHALQTGRAAAVWGQKLTTDVLPQLTSLDSAQVYSVKYLKGSTAFDSLYVNRYDTLALPTTGQIVGSSYNKLITYNTTFINSDSTTVNPSTPVTADMQITCAATANGLKMNGTGTTEEPYLISTAEELAAFRDYVNLGYTAICAKLMNDIDLVSVYGEGTGSWKAIENYNGTFDGAHHTINIGKHEYQEYPGLFGVINSNSKITNLHVEGIITDSISSNDYNGLGGIANMMVGGLVSNCSFSGKLNCAGLGGGIVGNVTKGGKITDCWSDADVFAEEVSGGIAGAFDYLSASNKDNIISNCLFLGTDKSDWMYDPIIYSFNDDDRSDGTVDNCYYINSDFSASGELVTVAQLKSGYVLGKLGSAWGQTLGEDTIPTPCKESKKGSANYIYHGADGWACDDFRITDGTALPVGLEFLAKKLTNSRTFSEGYYTVCLPYDLPVPVNTTYSDFSNVDDAHTTVNFTTGSGNMLSAYQPYMIKVTDRSVNLGGENISVKAQPASTSSTVFVGTVTGLTNEEAANAGAYILQSDNYWHPVKTENTNATIPAYRAYLVLPSASAAKSYRFVVDGVSTGISSVNAGSSISSGAVYDLQGRKIADNYEDVKNSLATGIYVVNGKKIVKK